jgi:hypothetical protein
MNNAKNIRFLALILLCLALVPLTVMAQSSNGSISGNLTDDTGAAIPGVTVSAVNVATGATRTAVSTSTGRYDIPNLSPGTYRVSAELSGQRRVGHRSEPQDEGRRERDRHGDGRGAARRDDEVGSQLGRQ